MNILRFISAFFLLLSFGITHGQISNNINLKDIWHPGDLPSASGVIYNDVWGYVDANAKEYAILGSAQFIHFIDITNPQNIVEVERVTPGQSTIWRDFKTFGTRAYAVSDNTSEGLLVMDLSTLPDSVSVTYQSTEFFTQCHNIFIDQNNERLYVAGANTQPGGLIVLDLSQDPDNPALLNSQALAGGYMHDLFVKDNIVYGSHGFNGLYIWDYRDLNNLKLLSSLQTNGYNHSSWLSEDCRYVIYAEEIPAGVDLGVIDVKNLFSGEIELVHTFKFPLLAPEQTNVTPHNPYIRDTMLIVSYYEDGTQVFTFGNPLNPQPYAYYDTHSNSTYRGTSGNWGTYPHFPSGNIISSDIKNGLFVMAIDGIDFSSIASLPTLPSVTLSKSGSIEACDYEEIDLTAEGPFESYQWFKDDQLLEMTGHTISITESGTYFAQANYGQCPISSEPVTFTIHKTTKPSIAILGNELEVMPIEGSYFWNVGTTTIDNVNNNLFKPDFSGAYWVNHLDLNGCSTQSDSVFFFLPKNYNISELEGLDVRYMSSSNELTVSLLSTNNQTIHFNLYNIVGQAIYRETKNISGLDFTQIDTKNLASGIYFLTVDNGYYQDAVKIYIY